MHRTTRLRRLPLRLKRKSYALVSSCKSLDALSTLSLKVEIRSTTRSHVPLSPHRPRRLGRAQATFTSNTEATSFGEHLIGGARGHGAQRCITPQRITIYSVSYPNMGPYGWKRTTKSLEVTYLSTWNWQLTHSFEWRLQGSGKPFGIFV